jgi:hypothetical protein
MAGRRIELGFEGGAVIAVTLEEAEVKDLTESLPSSEGWRAFTAEEGMYWVNMGELVYVRMAPGEVGRVGFGGR